ncbi:hypothetical protein [Bdellovibrio sp. HCB2-146]|uniref:hypothetical protein n=1 Tax=Bdellovibrio sp. HCB2-146 TaxID=3394362 RepID=UPI0039BD0CF7
MKSVNVLLGALVFALMACSDGGGNSKGGGGMPDLKPGMKPANAVSEADLQYYAQLMNNSQSFLPADQVVFNDILSGAQTEAVTHEQREEAKNRLSATGRQNISMIQQNCVIQDAESQTTGDQEFKVGAVSTTVGTMGIFDRAACPTLMNKRANSKNTIRSIEPLGSNSVRIVSFVENTESRSQTIESRSWQNSLQGARFNMEMASSGTVEATLANQSLNLKADVAGTGTLQVDLLQNDYIRGPISFNVKMDTATQKGQMQTLFDLQTTRGAIRIVVIGTESSQEIYINGEKRSPGMMKAFTSAIEWGKLPFIK